MKTYRDEQIIGQLEKRKGGYHFLKIDAAVIDQFENKSKTRFLCTLDDKLTFQCGLNHLGDGNFFIILAPKNLKLITKALGDRVTFELNEDPNPLGANMPEVLVVLLEQDEVLKDSFERLTTGQKRSVIFAVSKIKDPDLQVQRAVQLIKDVTKPRRRAL